MEKFLRIREQIHRIQQIAGEKHVQEIEKISSLILEEL